MSKFWCLVLAAALSSTAWARMPDGAGDEKKAGEENRAKSLEQLTAELETQSAQLEAQRIQIQALQSKTASMSLEGNGAVPNPQAQPKPALPEDIKSKWAMNIYGFVEADFIYDNRQSGNLTDGAFNASLPPKQTYAYEHDQVTFGARNSRIGFNVSAPEYAGIRASAKLEMDFEGTGGGGTIESNATWVNPTFRFRHMYLVLDSDYVTAQIGQGWQLFGWQPYFHPNTVDIQGVPGQVYSRSPKFQLSHKFRGPVDIEVAGAVSRPPERDSGTPDLQAGIKLTLPDWVGVHTMGSTGTAIDAAGIGISGLSRAFRVPGAGAPAQFSSDAVRSNAAAADLFLPVLHPDKESRGNSLSITGEVAYGAGYNEEYSGFTWGLGQANAAHQVANIADQGPVGFLNGDLKAIQLMSVICGIQYYLPGDGMEWIALNYSSCHSNNISRLAADPAGANPFTGAPTVFKASQWLNASLFWDVTPAVRLGLSFDEYRDTFINRAQSKDTRVQFSAFYLF